MLGATGNTSPGPLSISQGTGSAGILVPVSGAHLHSRPWEDETPTAMAAPHSIPDLVMAKRAARERALSARANGDPTAAGVALAAHVLRDCPPPPGAVVSGVWPLADEIDLRPLMQALHARGHPIVLPGTPPKGQPLTFHRWRPGDALVRERFGTLPSDRRGTRTRVPVGYPCWRSTGTCIGSAMAAATMIAPWRGCRRGISGLGCCFAAQEMDSVPVGPHDEALDAVATERGIHPPRGDLNAHSGPGRRGRPHRP